MSNRDERLIEAVNHAAAGDWQRAHEIVQALEGNRVASWIHALVHRLEGDLDNARYWYRRCGKQLDISLSAEAELEHIRAAIR
jgi:hypothetical protein